jgi:hypothetical protein
MLVVNMSLMLLKAIGKEVCLWVKGRGLACGLLKRKRNNHLI